MKHYIAHAGIHLNHTAAGRNSLESIDLAARAGFDWVEIDVRETSDGVIAALHDPTLNAFYQNADGTEIAEPVFIHEHSFAELREKYVHKADDAANRSPLASAAECLTRAKERGVTLLIHPKLSDHAHLDRLEELCAGIAGEKGWRLTSNNDAVRYRMTKTRLLPVMAVVSDEAEADEFAENEDSVLAVSYRHPRYRELVDHCHALGHPVETTCNTMVEADPAADVINYDYLSPSAFDRYETLLSTAPAHFELKSGESAGFSDDHAALFGTAELSFTLTGKADVTVCGRTWTLCADRPTAYRIPVLLYRQSATYQIDAAEQTTLEALSLRVGQH